MQNIPDKLTEDGTVQLPLDTYHKLLGKAMEKETNKEVYAKRRREIESAAREVEHFLSFLYQKTSIDMEDYITAFNTESKQSTLIIDDKNNRIKVDLGGSNDEQQDKEE